MMQTNCPNCGAPLDPERTKCPYCGTRYYDMAITDGEPFYLRYRTKQGIFVSKCVVNNCNIYSESSQEEIHGGPGNTVLFLGPPKVEVKIHMDYTAVPNEEGSLLQLIKY